MGRRPVYMGRNSCYALREGWFVRRLGGRGVDVLAEAVAILALIHRDLLRGYTYDPDRGCRKIRMTRELVERRARFLVRLARIHGGEALARRVERLVERYLGEYRIPRRIEGKSLTWWLGRALARAG